MNTVYHERIIELWECRACIPEYPCNIEIHSHGVMDPYNEKLHFRSCVCRKDLTPNWRKVLHCPVKRYTPPNNEELNDAG